MNKQKRIDISVRPTIITVLNKGKAQSFTRADTRTISQELVLFNVFN